MLLSVYGTVPWGPDKLFKTSKQMVFWSMHTWALSSLEVALDFQMYDFVSYISAWQSEKVISENLYIRKGEQRDLQNFEYQCIPFDHKDGLVLGKKTKLSTWNTLKYIKLIKFVKKKIILY